jgi:hypothetical protein
VIASAGLFGVRSALVVAGALELAAPGALLRATGASTSATDLAIAGTWQAWARATIEGASDGGIDARVRTRHCTNSPGVGAI